MKEGKIFPNLIIPGAAKSGSSSLHEYLKKHPDIFMSSIKEPHFFCNDSNYSEKKDDYMELFEDSGSFKYRGESSTGYMVFENTIERIKKDCENPKFIFVLRNPIDRCFSHYNWVKSFNKEKSNFENAILRDKEKIPNATNKIGGGYKYYFQFGLYGKWIEQYIKAFGRNNIYIITTEALKKDHSKVMNGIFSFLSLDPIEHIEHITTNKTNFYNKHIGTFILFKKINKKLKRHQLFNFVTENKKLKKFIKSYFISNKKVELTAQQRNWLNEMYKDDVNKLKEITGLNFDEWKDFSD